MHFCSPGGLAVRVVLSVHLAKTWTALCTLQQKLGGQRGSSVNLGRGGTLFAMKYLCSVFNIPELYGVVPLYCCLFVLGSALFSEVLLGYPC